MKKTRLLAFLLTACLATTCFLSGTVAKYSTTKSANDSARVARWSFKVGETDETNPADIAKTDVMTFTFDLFNTICDDGAVTTTTTTETDDANVSNATSTTAAEKMIIAPGTSGWFEIQLDNASEVTAKYTITFEVTNAGVGSGADNVKIPLLYKVVDTSDDSTATAEWKEAPGTFKCDSIEVNETDKVTVYWKWDFERGATVEEKAANNAEDTLLGIQSSLPEVSVKAIIVAEQVD